MCELSGNMINPEMLTGTFTYLAGFHATCHSINVQTRTEEHSCVVSADARRRRDDSYHLDEQRIDQESYPI